MAEELDMAALADQLIHENERLRLRILKLSNARSFRTPSMHQMRMFLTENYVVIAALGSIFFIVLSIVDTIREFYKGDK